MSTVKKVVLAYSGGVDTSACIPYLINEYGINEVIAFAADLGQGDELKTIQQKAIVPFTDNHDLIAQAQSGTGKTATFSIGLLQNTSLMAILGLVELLGVSRSILANPEFIGRYLEVYIWLAAVYWLICTVMALLSRHIERQMDPINPIK